MRLYSKPQTSLRDTGSQGNRAHKKFGLRLGKDNRRNRCSTNPGTGTDEPTFNGSWLNKIKSVMWCPTCEHLLTHWPPVFIRILVSQASTTFIKKNVGQFQQTLSNKNQVKTTLWWSRWGYTWVSSVPYFAWYWLCPHGEHLCFDAHHWWLFVSFLLFILLHFFF